MTKFKDVAHLYIGCRIQTVFHHSGGDAIFYGIQSWDVADHEPITKMNDDDDLEPYEDCSYGRMPVLRKLTDITFEEDQVEFPKNNRGHMIDMHWYPEGFAWLLSKSFDLFGLIESGKAIDASTLK